MRATETHTEIYNTVLDLPPIQTQIVMQSRQNITLLCSRAQLPVLSFPEDVEIVSLSYLVQVDYGWHPELPKVTHLPDN